MLAFGELHKLSEHNAFTNTLFFARSCKILTKIAFLQETQHLQNFCKIEKVLQGCCKNFARCIFNKNFAKVVLIAKILQDFCKNCFSCEIG